MAQLDVGTTIRLTPRVRLGGEMAFGIWAKASDCIRGFTVCAPAMQFDRATATLGYVFGEISSWSPSILIGVGGARVHAAGYGPKTLAPAQTLANYLIGADVPVAVFKRGAVLLGSRVTFIPNVIGGDATSWNVRLAFRAWR